MNQKVIAEMKPKILEVESKQGITYVLVRKEILEVLVVRELKDLNDLLNEKKP